MLHRPQRDHRVARLPPLAAGPYTGIGGGGRRMQRSETEGQVQPGPRLGRRRAGAQAWIRAAAGATNSYAKH